MREGNFRAELRRIALDQGLAGDAAFVAIGAADLTSISDRRYRELQLARLVAGRLHLAAYALGYGASGMTFLDSEIPSLLGEQLEAMLFTCVGVPEYANKRGGLRGARPDSTGEAAARLSRLRLPPGLEVEIFLYRYTMSVMARTPTTADAFNAVAEPRRREILGRRRR